MTQMMKKTIKSKGVATIAELRSLCLEAEVKMIGCQMSIDLFEMNRSDFIDGIEIGGAATWMETADKTTINLFI